MGQGRGGGAEDEDLPAAWCREPGLKRVGRVLVEMAARFFLLHRLHRPTSGVSQQRKQHPRHSRASIFFDPRDPGLYWTYYLTNKGCKDSGLPKELLVIRVCRLDRSDVRVRRST